jgi:hypothetical protein
MKFNTDASTWASIPVFTALLNYTQDIRFNWTMTDTDNIDHPFSVVLGPLTWRWTKVDANNWGCQLMLTTRRVVWIPCVIAAGIVVREYMIAESAPPKYPTREDILYARVSQLEEEIKLPNGERLCDCLALG